MCMLVCVRVRVCARAYTCACMHLGIGCVNKCPDEFLLVLALRTHIPTHLLRIPEVIFEGANVWVNLEEEEALDIRETITLFLYSVMLERLLHALMEVRSSWFTNSSMRIRSYATRQVNQTHSLMPRPRPLTKKRVW